ncbi:MAG: 16S rRNA (cytosine(1402)-N(4))-methyltransferase RsmH [Clostridia bacterium]|nr:16S rRNA (cytosine(1402)-N(4))-methyltransferase RsmH [Clostridia bacterium]
MEFNHISVLLNESVEALNIKPDGVYVDCTAGGGGHSNEILSHLNENGKMYLFDRDPDAIKVLTERFKDDKRVNIIHDNYNNIKVALETLGVSVVDGIVADLGVSSFQLDTAERGFSFHNDALLDMRMSKQGLSAKDVVNTYSQDELSRVIWEYGEEKFAKKIASNIVKARAKKEIETTFELSDIISASIPAKFKRDGHPARKTFQAIRIEVNNELGGLKDVLPDMFELLNTNGVLAIITFHSLEDKIVKDYFNTLKKGCTCPKDFPVCVCGNSPKAIVKSGGVKAGQKEVKDNKRSRSAKLRTALKL